MGLIKFIRSLFKQDKVEHVYYSEEYDSIIVVEVSPDYVNKKGPLVYLGTL